MYNEIIHSFILLSFFNVHGEDHNSLVSKFNPFIIEYY